ncbi:tRNA (guanosine(37)-N1)-methyltransferase TrmD, partial [Lactobacillus sp. UMNPBX4]
GNHQKIAEWRKKESLRRTYQRRPDLLEEYEFSDKEKEWLREFERDKDVKIHGKG